MPNETQKGFCVRVPHAISAKNKPWKDSDLTKEVWLAASFAIVLINLKTQMQPWLRDGDVDELEKDK